MNDTIDLKNLGYDDISIFANNLEDARRIFEKLKLLTVKIIYNNDILYDRGFLTAKMGKVFIVAENDGMVLETAFEGSTHGECVAKDFKVKDFEIKELKKYNIADLKNIKLDDSLISKIDT